MVENGRPLFLPEKPGHTATPLWPCVCPHLAFVFLQLVLFSHLSLAFLTFQLARGWGKNDDDFAKKRTMAGVWVGLCGEVVAGGGMCQVLN